MITTRYLEIQGLPDLSRGDSGSGEQVTVQGLSERLREQCQEKYQEEQTNDQKRDAGTLL